MTACSTTGERIAIQRIRRHLAGVPMPKYRRCHLRPLLESSPTHFQAELLFRITTILATLSKMGPGSSIQGTLSILYFKFTKPCCCITFSSIHRLKQEGKKPMLPKLSQWMSDLSTNECLVYKRHFCRTNSGEANSSNSTASSSSLQKDTGKEPPKKVSARYSSCFAVGKLLLQFCRAVK